MGRGQVSIEYLIVISFIVFIVLSMLGIAFFYSSSIQDRIKSSQINDFSKKIISASESVFYSGEPSKLTINTYLPAGVNSIEVIDNSIIISYQTSSGTTRSAFTPKVPINGTISNTEGVKIITVTAQEDSVIFQEE